MLKDRYDLALTTTSDAARDAYVEASGLAADTMAHMTRTDLPAP